MQHPNEMGSIGTRCGLAQGQYNNQSEGLLCSTGSLPTRHCCECCRVQKRRLRLTRKHRNWHRKQQLRSGYELRLECPFNHSDCVVRHCCWWTVQHSEYKFEEFRGLTCFVCIEAKRTWPKSPLELYWKQLVFSKCYFVFSIYQTVLVSWMALRCK